MTQEFRFAFDPRFRGLLALGGIRPATCRAVLEDDTLRVEFGRLELMTPLRNVREVEITRGYRWYRALGPRLSLVDHGATFGTNAQRGVCLRFHEPVSALFGERLRHPGATLTLEDPEAFARLVRERVDD